jgi:hypothetical protein
MKNSRRLLFYVVLALAVAATGVRACIWYQGTTLEGGFTQTDGAGPVAGSALLGERTVFMGMKENTAAILRAAMTGTPASMLHAIPRLGLPVGWPEGMDAAVELLFSGDAPGAVAKLTELDRRLPDNYWICANLGAACELSGDVPAALRWVEKAMAINPGAHEGTEWMHAAVLKARLALAADPAWLQTHTISGLPQGDVPAGFTISRGSLTLSLEDIRRALTAHTFARLLFVKPHDAIAAALLTELALVEARVRSVEDGTALLDLADAYGGQGSDAIRSRWNSLKPGLLRTYFHQHKRGALIAASVAGAAAILLFFVLLSRWLAARDAKASPRS